MAANKPKGKGILYVKLSSLTDLARYAYNFDFSSKSLILDRRGGTPRLIALGEMVGDAVIAYYINIDTGHSFVKYSFPYSLDQTESAHFSDSAYSEKEYINIFNVDLGNFKEQKVGSSSVIAVKVNSANDLVHAAIKKSLREESFATLYEFELGKKRYMAGFDLIEELADDRKTFYYAETKDRHKGGFVKYSYANNTFEFTETVGEHSYIYARVISLAEPFPFFKVPD
ncbi:MAG: hypothetical protein QXF01_01360 [Candidatus Micrarchaeaceae archaeon]